MLALMGLWPETMSTFALVISSDLLALARRVADRSDGRLHAGVRSLVEPILDLIQTMPPYIYLLPAIALLGFGPATALAATLHRRDASGLPPDLARHPHDAKQFVELGQATGITPCADVLQDPPALRVPSIMAGINQSLMMAFGMVVIAGIVGSGGLGETIYEAIRTLDIGKSIDAAIAIVILTMVIDRITQGSRPRPERTRQ